MSESMKRLNQYKEKFGTWNEERIQKLYNRLQAGETLTLQIVSLESQGQIIKEINKVNNSVNKSQIFDKHQSVNNVGLYLLTFWEEVQSSVMVINEKNDYEKFKNWFNDLIETDMDYSGLAITYEDFFIVEWSELEETEEYSYSELWKCIEEEDLI